MDTVVPQCTVVTQLTKEDINIASRDASRKTVTVFTCKSTITAPNYAFSSMGKWTVLLPNLDSQIMLVHSASASHPSASTQASSEKIVHYVINKSSNFLHKIIEITSIFL